MLCLVSEVVRFLKLFFGRGTARKTDPFTQIGIERLFVRNPPKRSTSGTLDGWLLRFVRLFWGHARASGSAYDWICGNGTRPRPERVPGATGGGSARIAGPSLNALSPCSS